MSLGATQQTGDADEGTICWKSLVPSKTFRSRENCQGIRGDKCQQQCGDQAWQWKKWNISWESHLPSGNLT